VWFQNDITVGVGIAQHAFQFIQFKQIAVGTNLDLAASTEAGLRVQSMAA
jgi:hypothetical protein